MQSNALNSGGNTDIFALIANNAVRAFFRSEIMKEFKKSSKLNNVCYDIRGPVMDEAEKMAANNQKILRLNIGNPAPFGFKAPQKIIDKIENSLTATEGYSDSKGLLSARQAIVDYCKNKKGI